MCRVNGSFKYIAGSGILAAILYRLDSHVCTWIYTFQRQFTNKMNDMPATTGSLNPFYYVNRSLESGLYFHQGDEIRERGAQSITLK